MDRIRRGVWPSLLALAAGIWTFGCHQVSCFRRQVCVCNWSWTTCGAQAGVQRPVTCWRNWDWKSLPKIILRCFALLEQRSSTDCGDAQTLLTLAELADRISRTRELTAPDDAMCGHAMQRSTQCFASKRWKRAMPSRQRHALAIDVHNRTVTTLPPASSKSICHLAE